MVNRREPVRNTGRASSIFFCKSAVRRPLAWVPSEGVLAFSIAASSLARGIESAVGEEWPGFIVSGVTQSSNMHVNIAKIDRLHGIQADISVVAAAINEPISSAT